VVSIGELKEFQGSTLMEGGAGGFFNKAQDLKDYFVVIRSKTKPYFITIKIVY